MEAKHLKNMEKFLKDELLIHILFEFVLSRAKILCSRAKHLLTQPSLLPFLFFLLVYAFSDILCFSVSSLLLLIFVLDAFGLHHLLLFRVQKVSSSFGRFPVGGIRNLT